MCVNSAYMNEAPLAFRHPRPANCLIIALDVGSVADAQRIVQSVSERTTLFKVGLELFTSAGPDVVRDLVASGRRVFLDLKFHDIPNTVAGAVRSAASLGASMLTVHAAGGEGMLTAAVETARLFPTPPLVLAVTVLTSMDETTLSKTGVSATAPEQVERLADLALRAGCPGLVCSPQEVQRLRQRFGPSPVLVTPGIRPTGSAAGDQARLSTPAEALRAGADYLVVGRPITQAANPGIAAGAILDELTQAR